MEREESKGFYGYERIPTQPTFSSGTWSRSPFLGLKQPAESNNNGNGDTNNTDDNNECTVREQDRFMPIANVIRIMRKILPPHAKISDDAKETIQECVSEYISFITSEANERCQREQRKTITAEDVLWAMSKLGFDEYIEPLTFYLNRYRDLEGDRGSIRAKPLVNRIVGPDPNGMGVPFNGVTFGPMGGYQYHQHQHIGLNAGVGGNGFYPSMVGYAKEASPSQDVAGVEHNGQYAQGNN